MIGELELDVVHPKTGKILPKPTTLDEKASFLNQRNLLRPRGSLWDRTGVSRLIKRVEKLTALQSIYTIHCQMPLMWDLQALPLMQLLMFSAKWLMPTL
jgi:hypothetical protein